MNSWIPNRYMNIKDTHLVTCRLNNTEDHKWKLYWDFGHQSRDEWPLLSLEETKNSSKIRRGVCGREEGS